MVNILKEKLQSMEGKRKVKFICKVGKMRNNKGKIIWIPKKYAEVFDDDTYVQVTMRKLR